MYSTHVVQSQTSTKNYKPIIETHTNQKVDMYKGIFINIIPASAFQLQIQILVALSKYQYLGWGEGGEEICDSCVHMLLMI